MKLRIVMFESLVPESCKLIHICNWLRLLQHSEQYKGVRLSTGQDLFSHHLVLDPTFKFPLPPASSPPDLSTSLKDNKGKVARGICITTSSMKPDISNCFLVYPPGCKTLYWSCYYDILQNNKHNP